MKDAYGEMLRELGHTETLVFSMGNESECHGGALYEDTDSYVATSAAIEAAEKTGARYAGRIPYTTDRVGEAARAWMPAYLPVEDFYSSTLGFLKPIVEYYQGISGRKPEVVIVAGHGGIPRELETVIHEALGVDAKCVFPGADFGMHAGDEEHSLMVYLDYFSKEGLDEVQETAQREPREALARWPQLFGLSGYWYDEGIFDEVKKRHPYALDGFDIDDFQMLRRPGKVERVEAFLQDKNLRIDAQKGQKAYEGFVSDVVKAIES
ncbi:MAG: hypothetical protein JW727_04640 [Candidatus Aenigmarchaeota archaeon]|nr:hypothetical protein [Candidatus Aenigmarchaeota archaeon]